MLQKLSIRRTGVSRGGDGGEGRDATAVRDREELSGGSALAALRDERQRKGL